MPKKFMLQHRIGGFWLVVEDYVDAMAPDAVLVSLRGDVKGARRPGPRTAFENVVGRAQLFGLAYDLIDVAEVMLPETTLNTSAAIAKGGALPIPRNKRFADGAREHRGPRHRPHEDGVMAAFARIQGRMPVLQRAQRVLERCDDATADYVEDILIQIERAGSTLPLAWMVPPLEPAREPPPAKPGLLARFASLTRAKRPVPADSDPDPIPF